MDAAARAVLPLLVRGIGLRSDAMNGILDDTKLPSGVVSSCELHVARYRGTTAGESHLLRFRSGAMESVLYQPTLPRL